MTDRQFPAVISSIKYGIEQALSRAPRRRSTVPAYVAVNPANDSMEFLPAKKAYVGAQFLCPFCFEAHGLELQCDAERSFGREENIPTKPKYHSWITWYIVALLATPTVFAVIVGILLYR